MEPEEKRKYPPFPLCPVCGQKLGQNGQWMATSYVCGYQVHSPECFRQAERVARAALQAQYPGCAVGERAVLPAPELGGLFDWQAEPPVQRALEI
jgi:hypothetical protein